MGKRFKNLWSRTGHRERDKQRWHYFCLGWAATLANCSNVTWGNLRPCVVCFFQLCCVISYIKANFVVRQQLILHWSQDVRYMGSCTGNDDLWTWGNIWLHVNDVLTDYSGKNCCTYDANISHPTAFEVPFDYPSIRARRRRQYFCA